MRLAAAFLLIASCAPAADPLKEAKALAAQGEYDAAIARLDASPEAASLREEWGWRAKSAADEAALLTSKQHEMKGRLDDALAALGDRDAPPFRDARARIKLKIGEAQRGDLYRRAIVAAEAAETEAGSRDGVKSWQAVIDAYAKAAASASSSEERAKASARIASAESRRDWVAAREALAAGDPERALKLATKAAAAKDAPEALVAFAESLRTANVAGKRREEYETLAAQARAEKDPIAAYRLWKRAHDAAEESGAQLEALEQLMVLEKRLDTMDAEMVYEYRLAQFDEAMRKKAHPAAFDLLAAAADLKPKGKELKDGWERLRVAAPLVAYSGWLKRGRDFVRKGDLKRGKAAFEQSLLAKPGDAAATKELRDVEERLSGEEK